jgi:ATP-dependent Clp protease ATP-binding subunit ClpA
MNDHVEERNPLIGREAELERTIQVLCRRDKNNPLHVGEPGVGKTALVWGLARRINSGNVPQRLKDSRIYQLDMGTLLAGTQYRGDFENRIKQIMDGISGEAENNIVYIDEIHTLVGAGAVGDSSMDASNMLKPYLETSHLRFIGSTTYEEYNKHFSRSKGLVRRFQQIDISEPTIDETKNILRQLRPKYEEFHKVIIEDAAIDFAVEASAKHVNDRYLPDKAIDLIDEAGAALEAAETNETYKPNIVTKPLIAEILSKTCKVDALAMKEDNTTLETLQQRMSANIYGQDEAVRQVVEAVQMSKAGLTDDNKPLASLLFVGPTGVGKTEVARVLAHELGIELLRFDMSEYTEKHTVAKLIGSPAGYVGYEDGGLLTDAIRKTPNCVLLLDEIEKAHQDIYNILLQVMDYAKLTDNKGRKADFRNVILLMTSNAGAQYASQANIGFSGHTSRGEAMLGQVKKTFKPEFLNRLSGTVVFNDMDKTMATLILQKKLRELQEKLTQKQVTMTLTDDAFEHLLNKGFTREYGAREMDRVISQQLKPLLMREILFGELKNGGNVTIETGDDGLQIRR